MRRAHQITVTPARARVVVSVGGHRVAESDRALVLQEGSLPPRYYLPREDVRTDLLRPSTNTSTCPFKGQASYWSVVVDGQQHDDVVWSYEAPIDDVGEIAGLLCFYNERVELEVEPAS